MRWEWLALVLCLGWFRNWPWLLVVAALSWPLSYPHWPSTVWPLVCEVVGVLGAESVLAYVGREHHQTMAEGAALEGAALGGLALLWGTFPGILAWGGSLGFDAASRGRRFIKTVGRQAIVRTVRVLLGVVFVVLYHAGAL